MAEIDIDNLTLGQIKALRQVESGSVGISDYVGKKVIVRTLSAGVFYGVLLKKAGDEVILGSSRRLWQWFAKRGHIIKCRSGAWSECLEIKNYRPRRIAMASSD